MYLSLVMLWLLDNVAVSEGEEGNIINIPCNYCLYRLFYNSAQIENVSENFLPATSLEGTCYSNMFSGCSSLNSIKIGYTGIMILNILVVEYLELLILAHSITMVAILLQTLISLVVEQKHHSN